MMRKRLFGLCLCVLLLCSVFPVRLVTAEDAPVNAPTESTPIDESEEQSDDAVPTNEEAAPNTGDEDADDPAEDVEADSDGTDGADHADSDVSDDNSAIDADRDDTNSTEVSENPETGGEETAEDGEGVDALSPADDMVDESLKALSSDTAPLNIPSVTVPTVPEGTVFKKVTSMEPSTANDVYIFVGIMDGKYYAMSRITIKYYHNST